MLRTAAKVFGYILLIIGILGFIPGITTDEHLLGIFHVNGIHNIIHIVTGVLAIWAGSTSTRAARRYFQVFAVVYGALTLIGLFYGEDPLFGFVAHNVPDIFLHLLITATALYFGFVAKDEDRPVA